MHRRGAEGAEKKKKWKFFLCVLCASAVNTILLHSPACAQFVSVAGGAVWSQDLRASAGQTVLGRPIVHSSDFTRAGIITADLGVGFLPFLGGSIHYSFAKPELFLQRGDAFSSSALMELGTHTLTLDGRLRSPEFGGFRIYGFAGGGVSRSNISIKQMVENPFGGAPPDNATYAVFTFGGGAEQRVAPLVRLKFEVRDYMAPIPDRFFLPGGLWHRVVLVGGLTIGR